MGVFECCFKTFEEIHVNFLSEVTPLLWKTIHIEGIITKSKYDVPSKTVMLI